MGESATEPEHDEEAAQPSSSLASVWATAVVLAALLVFVFVYDFVALGDGAVGVQSEALPIGRIPTSDGGLEELVGREPGGVMSVGLPLRNRGLVGVTVTGLELDGTAGPCPWSLRSLGRDRERAEQAAADATADLRIAPFKVPGGATSQLYIGATFPQDACASDDQEEASVGAVSLDYKVLGIIPRHQELQMGTVITTTGNQDDPRLESVETLD